MPLGKGSSPDNPNDWNLISDNNIFKDKKVWQCRRNPSCFSLDQGKTYYDISERKVPWWKFWIPKTKAGFRLYKSKKSDFK